MLRLSQMLESPYLINNVWRSYGYIIGYASSPQQAEIKSGPRTMFFSAGNESHIVGATASLLLELDEAQDITPEKFDTELRPMASTTNSTCVLYGTAWSDSTLLAQVSAHNQELEQQDGIQRHFAYDWTTLAAINENYRKFVEGEIARLGEDSVSIRTQYRLLPISGAGLLLNDLQRHLLKGSHNWLDEPDEDEDGYYTMSCDVGGESRPKPGDSTSQAKRDSTVITIGRVTYNELDLPAIQIVHQCWWNGWKYSDQYAGIAELMNIWNIRKLVIDKTGLGEGLASLLIEKFSEERVEAFHFTRPSKSALTFQFLGMINSGRLKMYASDGAPGQIFEEAWSQLTKARYSVPGENLINMAVAAEEGHDDFLISIALLSETVRDFLPPVQESSIVKPRRLYRDGRF